MKEKTWTLLLLGDDPEGVRQFTISPRLLRWLIGGAAVFSLTVMVLFGVLVINGGAFVKAHNLSRENTLLTQELDQFRARVDGLETTMAHLTEQDIKVRQLAGLDATDAEILEVGIGGPGQSSLEGRPLWAADSALGNQAFAVEYDLGALERRARLLSASLSEATDSLSAHRDLLESTPSIMPVAGVLSSRFASSRFHPIHHRPLPHEGIDISAARGTPILAAAKGTVTFAGWKVGFGNTVEIDHGYGFVTLYGHCSKLLVSAMVER